MIPAGEQEQNPDSVRRRPIKTDSHVWCDFHCTIHEATSDPYQEGVGDDCRRRNWRPVYVLGERGETF